MPPRKIWGGPATRGRLTSYERWQGKLALPQEMQTDLFPDANMMTGVSPTYEVCEEGAVIYHALQAAVVVWLPLATGGGKCFAVPLTAVPPRFWDPRNWPLIAAKVGFISALCLPLLPTLWPDDERQLNPQITPRQQLGRTARRLARWAAGNRISDIDATIGLSASLNPVGENGSDASVTSRVADVVGVVNGVGGSIGVSDGDTTLMQGHANCLLTPVHPPHFPHLVILLEAVQRLALDPLSARPLHIVVVDSVADATYLCKKFPRVCEGLRQQGSPKGKFVIEKAQGGSQTLRLTHLALLTLEESLPPGETMSDVFAIRQEHEQSHNHSGWVFRRYGSCATGWGQVHQGLKKIYGLIAARRAFGCEVTWALDADSFPLKPFHFSAIFATYRTTPWVQVQDYGAMAEGGAGYGAPQLIFQECAHWLVTQKLRLQPAGAFGYRPSDFWIYANSDVEVFVEELRQTWGGDAAGASFLDIWMRAPAHGEGLVLPAWLHIRRAGGVGAAASNSGEAFVHSAGGRTDRRLRVLDVASTVRDAMPDLYAATCRNSSVAASGEVGCGSDFAVVPRALRALGLPESLQELDVLLRDFNASISPARKNDRKESGGRIPNSHGGRAGKVASRVGQPFVSSEDVDALDIGAPASLASATVGTGANITSAKVGSFLQLLRLLDDELPIFGMQGHGEAAQMAALPALLPYWSRATSWCTSNCDWQEHASASLASLGLSDVFRDVLGVAVGYIETTATPREDLAPAKVTFAASTTGKKERVQQPRRMPWEEQAEGFRCFQWHLEPEEAGFVDHSRVVDQSWARCLDVLHYEAEGSTVATG
eukprot:TRINITY_DN42964_c0_g1_i1.p1 TRINITY_DN42964_c0_g1~~TRINITY_DN42964_c0_g1_i1.p1  ORF type:complete len:964 (+),score=116.20 TRINITY_DN42964_c0_g1_i1:417-2894(+)